MKKKYLITFAMGCLLSLMTADLISYSDGAPESRTAAPGELACNNGYCHNSYPRNSGDGLLEVLTPRTTFRAGETQSIQVKIKDIGQHRFGFEIVALWDSTLTSAGKFLVNEDSNFQIKYGNNRQYVTHDSAQVVGDSANWTLNWVAPSIDSGSVTFYVASVAANYNQNSTGDYVYTISHQLTEDTTSVSIDPRYSLVNEVDIRYLSDLSLIQLTGKANMGQLPVRIQLVDIQGKVHFGKSTSLVANTSIKIPTSRLSKGIYAVILEGNGRGLRKKIFVN